MMVDFSNLHHAYLLVGEARDAESYLHQLFESQGERLQGSPDFFPSRMKVFGVDEARELNTVSAGKAFGVRKVFLIAPERITLAAQNALLKTFEDPVPGTHFFLIVRERELIIPTLLSRMQVHMVPHAVSEELGAEQFLKSSVVKRLDFSRKFADKELNLSAFLDSLLLLLRTDKQASRVAQVYKQRLVSDQQGASARLILEHLSLVL